MPAAFCITRRKNVGKTSLIERLLPELVTRGSSPSGLGNYIGGGYYRSAETVRDASASRCPRIRARCLPPDHRQ